MDPHNDFDKHDHPPVVCRCGHERDDHGSRTETRGTFTRDELHLIESALANRAADKFYQSEALAEDREQLVAISKKAGQLAKQIPGAAEGPTPEPETK